MPLILTKYTRFCWFKKGFFFHIKNCFTIYSLLFRLVIDFTGRIQRRGKGELGCIGMYQEEKSETGNTEILSYLCTAEGGEGEITEKKSRFIAAIAPVQSEEEALGFLEETKKKYWDARHHCWAFILGKRSELMRYSDDGEPQGTAGKPILEVLRGAGLTFTAAVVTRYFGGTLLGTGGLVRAYTQAAQAGVRNAVMVTMRYGKNVVIRMDYADVNRIQYLLEQKKIPVLRARYEEKVEMDIILPFEDTDRVRQAMIEATQARASVTITGEGFFQEYS